MSAEAQPKVVRSYTLVFRRRWRIFRVQNWRIPLPGGLELRLLGYWLCCLGAMAFFAGLPGVGAIVSLLPLSVRLLVVPLMVSWALSRWEVDGRSPHRALFGAAGWLLRSRVTAAFRRVPSVGGVYSPIGELAATPDVSGPRYPRGRLIGPARVLLRYPVVVEVLGLGRRDLASARRLRVRGAGTLPMHRGRTLEVPAGREVRFE